MLLALLLSTRDELVHGARTTSALSSNVVIPWAIYLAGVIFVISMLSLPYRLRFGAEGMTRSTLLEPRFVPWHAVLAAQITVFRAYFGLELRVGRWRTVLIPLRGYGRPASLVDAIAACLPVGIRDPGNILPQLREQEAGLARR